MKTTARITWALVSLGLLFHCVSNSTAADDVNTTITTAPQSTKAPDTAAETTPTTTPTVPITPQPITSAIDTTASAASAGITKPTAPAAQATSATVPTNAGGLKDGLTTQPNPVPNPGSTPSTPAIATKQPVITPAAVPTVTAAVSTVAAAAVSTVAAAAVSTVAAAAVTTAAAAPSNSTDAKMTIPTQNTSPGLTGPGKDSSISATPSATTAKQGTDGTSGNVIPTALTTSPVKTTPRTSNGVTLPPTTTAVTEKKVTTSPLLQSTTTAPAAVSTPSKILTPSPPPPTPPTTVTAVETTKTILFTKGQENKKEKELGKVCTKLMESMNEANCTMTVRQHEGKTTFHNVQIEGTVDVTLATQYYEEITKDLYEEITKVNAKKSGDNSTLIAILASCGALLVMIVGLAIYAHHRKPYHENQQHLTEELHTVENGYHDNPTLEVMEVQPEMQEKKMALNCEFNDSWIVPIDNLLKEDLPDEEDTHL